jgi:hypothetical protein
MFLAFLERQSPETPTSRDALTRLTLGGETCLARPYSHRLREGEPPHLP